MEILTSPVSADSHQLKVREVKNSKKIKQIAPFATVYAFSSFDKYDSLIYLPTALTRHMKSGAVRSLSKFLCTHLDKKCAVNLLFLSVNVLIITCKLVLDLHPDTLQVVQNEVDGICVDEVHGQRLTHQFLRHTNKKPTFTHVLQMDLVQG